MVLWWRALYTLMKGRVGDRLLWMEGRLYIGPGLLMILVLST